MDIGILRDPIWQFVAAFLTFLTVIISVVLYFTQRKRKLLKYEILSKLPILSVEEEIAGKLQILFQDKPISRVFLTVIKLVNAGNVPISSSDYERNITISFGDSSKVLTAEISKTDPENLGAEISIKNSSIELKPVLLNPRDFIIIKALISNFGEEINVNGRIVGVKQIQQMEKNKMSKWMAFLESLVKLGLYVTIITIFFNVFFKVDILIFLLQIMMVSALTIILSLLYHDTQKSSNS